MRPQFSPHGSYEAHIEGRLVVARSHGTWNMEMYEESARIVSPLIRELNLSGPWGYMVIVEDTLVYHREVLAQSGAWVRTPYASQLTGAAWVISPALEGYTLLVPAYKNAYGGAVPCEVFADAEEAKAWLNTLVAARSG
jgi:hypothetical protein